MGRNLKNIQELSTVAELKKVATSQQREIKAAYKTIDKLLKDNNKKDEKIKQLESNTPKEKKLPEKKEESAPIIRIEITPEEEIAEHQLDRLRSASKTRALTLEETRMYDLLVKNKRLSQEKSTLTVENTQYKEIPNATLLEIAGKTNNGKKEDKS